MPPVGQFREHTLGETVERAGDEQDVHIAACSPVRGKWGRTTAAFRAPPPGRFLRPDRIPRVWPSAIPSGRLEVASQLRRLLDDMHDMHDVPATALHRSMRILAWNRAAAELLTAFGALPPHERNCIRLMSSTRASSTCRRLAGGRTRVRRRTAPGGGAPSITPSPETHRRRPANCRSTPAATGPWPPCRDTAASPAPPSACPCSGPPRPTGRNRPARRAEGSPRSE
ncbi:MmyB family transcriptional regulator [Streptomyces cellulosae]